MQPDRMERLEGLLREWLADAVKPEYPRDSTVMVGRYCWLCDYRTGHAPDRLAGRTERALEARE